MKDCFLHIVAIFIASNSPLDPVQFTVFAIFIGVLFRPCFLMITPGPVGPAFDCGDPPVKAIMVLLVPVSMMELM